MVYLAEIFLNIYYFYRVPGSEWALSQAKINLVQHYFLVGVTEELQDFIALLEASLPRFFQGATNYFIEGKYIYVCACLVTFIQLFYSSSQSSFSFLFYF